MFFFKFWSLCVGLGNGGEGCVVEFFWLILFIFLLCNLYLYFGGGIF